jgi:hypothetical protein
MNGPESEKLIDKARKRTSSVKGKKDRFDKDRFGAPQASRAEQRRTSVGPQLNLGSNRNCRNGRFGVLAQ